MGLMKLENVAVESDGSINPVGQFTLLLIGALSFIMAFAWNNVSQEIFSRNFRDASMTSVILYALIVTVIVSFFIYVVSYLHQDYINHTHYVSHSEK